MNKTILASIISIALLSSTIQAAEKLKLFVSDGCSSFPDGTLQQKELWLDCCQVHDKAYWQGGTGQQRLVADNSLKECVAKVANPKIAKLMLAGVRVGGSPYWPTSFRWGYGWPYPKKYAPLTNQEKRQVELLWKQYLATPISRVKNPANPISIGPK